MDKVINICEKQYTDWISDLKIRFKESQIKASIKVNSELIKFNWQLGRDIVNMKAEAKWGSEFYKSLSNDLKRAVPNSSGFSVRNLQYMKQFYCLFPALDFEPQVGAQIVGTEITPQVGAQLFLVPWNHIKLIVDKCGDNQEKAIFYINSVIKNNWSRSVLMNQISVNLFERQGKAITNFDYVLPATTSELAKEITKDPYNFDFL